MPLPTRYFSKKQEKRVAKFVKGSQTPNSGATPFYKGDVVTEDWLIECKTCIKPQQSFSIKKEWLDKLREEAIGNEKHHRALVFDFGDGEDHFIITKRDFQLLVEMLRNC